MTFRLLLALSLLCPFASAQTLLVLAKAEAKLLFIDAASGKTLSTFAVGDGPHEITVSADGKKAYVANYGAQIPGSTLSIIDIAAKKELKRLDVSPLRRPHGLFTAGDKVFVTHEANRAVARIDTNSDIVDWLIGTGQAGTHMVVASSDGKTLFTANIPANTVSRIDMSRGNGAAPDAISVAQVAKQPEAIAISPDGKEVWVGSNGEGTITILDAQTLATKHTLRGHKVPIRVRFTHDGTRALISDPEAGEITIYDVSQRKELKRLKVEGTPIGSIVNKDDTRAYVASAAANKVIVLDLKKMEVVSTINAPGHPDGIALVE
jgi:DNA-binding beta-propeller fold protein YncE